MITHEEKKHLKIIIYSNLILSALISIVGLVFLIFPSFVLKILPYLLISVLILKIIFQILCIFSTKDKLVRISFLIEIILSLTIIILLFIFNDKQISIIALLMGIYSLIEAYGSVLDLIKTKQNKMRYLLNISLVIIHIIFAISLFINLESSVKVHLTIYGLLFLIKGIFSIIKILIHRHQID